MKNIVKSIGFILLYFAVNFAAQVLISIPAAAKDPDGLNLWMNNNMLLISAISNVVTVIVFAVIFKLRKASIKEEWKLNKISIKNAVLPLVTAFTFSSAFSLLTYNMSFNNMNMISASVDYYASVWKPLGIIMMAFSVLVMAPISEEVLCRGIIFTRIEKSFSPVTALVLSSVFFGLMHVSAGGVVLSVGAIFMASVFGLIFLKTKSLPLSILAHTAANLPDFIMFSRPELNDTFRISAAIVLFTVSAACIVIMCRKKYEV